jgi:hypothetical protein
MGMTLHKVMGWGLTDVVTSKDGGWHGLADPRINADSRLFDYDDPATAVDYLRFLHERAATLAPQAEKYSDAWMDAHLDAYLDRSILGDVLHVDTSATVSARQQMTWRDLRPGAAVTHCGEYGDPSVLVVRPLTLLDWAHRNDPLDHAEEALTGRYTQGRVQVMPWAPYPFSGSWMDARDGRGLPDSVMVWVRLASRLRDEPDLDAQSRVGIEQAMVAVAEASLGFDDGRDAFDAVVPCVPGEVRALAEFGDLFTGPDVWRQLRPVIYTYWS